MVALQSEQWLVWQAMNEPGSVTQANLDIYNEKANAGLGEIIGALGVLSATWPEAYATFAPVAQAVFRFDEVIGQAIIVFRENPAQGVERLASLYGEVMPYHWYAYAQVSRVVEGHDVRPYDSSEWNRTGL